jgi:predicted transcriptional regulator
MNNNKSDNLLLELASRIVSAYVSKNIVPPKQLPQLIRHVHDARIKPSKATSGRPEPPVSVTRSVRPDDIICLEDGKKLKLLKRHLNTAYDMSPADCWKKWGLPDDYPMVAPRYAEKRRELAKRIGFGRMAKAKAKLSTEELIRKLGQGDPEREALWGKVIGAPWPLSGRRADKLSARRARCAGVAKDG